MNQPTEADLLNHFRELEGLTLIQIRLWRRLWLEKGQPVSREELFASVWGTVGDPHADRHLFDTHLHRLRSKLGSRGWEVTPHPGRRGNVYYSLHPYASDDPEAEPWL